MSPPPSDRLDAPVSSARLTAESWEALFRAQVTLLRRFADDDVWDPITMREYDVLFTLSRCPDARARLRELNRESLLSQPSLSRMVERLDAAGYVAREPDPVDRRGTVVVLTEAGAQMQRRIGQRHAASIRRYFGPALDDEELRTLQQLCDKLRLAQEDIADS
ncbi:MarR family winged helix-turn-helix transcriptional regulator [Pseudonocardia sp. H11422]|uniref:MarR family winged helix-turn-helix transcriptional regulator n=1 Tax=Pseudonocardia sp. H11422 TaxID=2835866 RepID=UPI001BDC1B22|nr:MarR family winged helix-turn-helix transcriptional regulator [Pseudonocardia sp. H11422]